MKYAAIFELFRTSKRKCDHIFSFPRSYFNQKDSKWFFGLTNPQYINSIAFVNSGDHICEQCWLHFFFFARIGHNYSTQVDSSHSLTSSLVPTPIKLQIYIQAAPKVPLHLNYLKDIKTWVIWEFWHKIWDGHYLN